MGREKTKSRNKKPEIGSLKDVLNVKENNNFKNTNVYLNESSINQNSERILFCEKITTTQTIANVIERENLKEQNIPDLKLITSGPKEICVTKRINQSLIHKNKKTFKEQKDDLSNGGLVWKQKNNSLGQIEENTSITITQELMLQHQIGLEMKLHQR